MRILQIRRLGLPLVLCAFLTGCKGVLSPFVGGDAFYKASLTTGSGCSSVQVVNSTNPGADGLGNTNITTITNIFTQTNVAVSYSFAEGKANALETEIIGKRKDVYRFKFWSGAGVVGSGIAGAGMVAYGANQSLLIGASMFAGTFIGARSYVPMDTRLKIYNTALSSIESAKIGVYPIPTNSDTGAAAASKTLLTQIQSYDFQTFPEALAVRVQAEKVARLLDSSSAAIANFNDDTNRGTLLYKALITIVNTANNSLVDETLDPGAALQAATNGIAEERNKVAKAGQKAANANAALSQQTATASMLLKFRQQLAIQKTSSIPPAGDHDSDHDKSPKSDQLITDLNELSGLFDQRLQNIGADQ